MALSSYVVASSLVFDEASLFLNSRHWRVDLPCSCLLWYEIEIPLW